MRRDVLELRQFYASELGRAVRAMVIRKVTETWGDGRGLDILGLGYATPFLGLLRPSARRVVAEWTPFGHGRTFSRRQLGELLREAELEPSGWTRALYVPPASWLARWAEGFEQVGSRLWPGFAGLMLMEAVKQTFAVKPKGV